MPQILTPEHMQLLSDQRLDQEAKRDAGDEPDADVRRQRQAMARAAVLEITRRRGSEDAPSRESS